MEEIESCAICLGELPSTKHPLFHTALSCRHVYHTLCLRNWLFRSASCPTCRTTPNPWPFSDIIQIHDDEDEDLDADDHDEDDEDDSSESDSDAGDDDGEEYTIQSVGEEDDESMDDEHAPVEGGEAGEVHAVRNAFNAHDDDLVLFRARAHRELRVTVTQAAHQLLQNDERLGSVVDILGHGIPIGDHNAITLLRAMSTNTKCASLDLMGQNITTSTARILGTVLKRNRGIRYVDLSDNDINAAGVAAIARALVRNRRVTHLFLNSIFVGDEGAVELSKALLSNQSLQVLGLRATRIGPVGARAIANSLKQNTSVRHLDLGQNPRITNAAKTAFAEAVGVRNKDCVILFE
jgi:hypothetical protein